MNKVLLFHYFSLTPSLRRQGLLIFNEPIHSFGINDGRHPIGVNEIEYYRKVVGPPRCAHNCMSRKFDYGKQEITKDDKLYMNMALATILKGIPGKPLR